LPITVSPVRRTEVVKSAARSMNVEDLLHNDAAGEGVS